MISVEGSQAAAVQLNITGVMTGDRAEANEYRGTYFGAMGTFTCVGEDACVIDRPTTGTTGASLVWH